MLYSPPVLSAHPVEGPSPAGDALKVGVWSPDNDHCVTHNHIMRHNHIITCSSWVCGALQDVHK